MLTLLLVVPGSDREEVVDHQPAGARHPRGLEHHRARQVAPLRRHEHVGRAQPEAAGIAVSDGSGVVVYKDLGLVAQVFDEPTLASLRGHLAIGHTRYSTTGGSTWENAQPTIQATDSLGLNSPITDPLNVTGPAISAGIAAIEDVAHQERSREHNTRWLDWLTAEIGKLGLKVTPSVANFVLIHFPETKGRTAADADAFLTARGLILRQTSAYKLPNALRMTVGTEEANRLVVGALKEFLGRT